MNSEYVGKRVLLSGGFDPVHDGHVAMIQDAAKYGDVVIALNSDDWLVRKKGFAFMPWAVRRSILLAIRGVVDVIAVDDSDGTAVKALWQVYPDYFGNGGDRGPKNTPELAECTRLKIETLFGLGGQGAAAISHSSKFMRGLPFARDYEKRPWGSFFTISEEAGFSKVKVIRINPGHRTSLQLHQQREEVWQIVDGHAQAEIDGESYQLRQGFQLEVPIGVPHRLMCEGERPAVIIEHQLGKCDESDIVRLSDDYGRAIWQA